jgi:hypothetical protein
VQGYAGHHCNLPTRRDPEMVACSMYFNSPIPPRSSPGFEASNWAISSPAFVPERKEIWYSDGNTGFWVVRVTNDAWKSSPPAPVERDPASPVGEVVETVEGTVEEVTGQDGDQAEDVTQQVEDVVQDVTDKVGDALD